MTASKEDLLSPCFGVNDRAAAAGFFVIIAARPDQSQQRKQSHCQADGHIMREEPRRSDAHISEAVSRATTIRVVMIALSAINVRRVAIALCGRCGEIAIAYAVLRAQEAGSRGRYQEMASWRSIAEAVVRIQRIQ